MNRICFTRVPVTEIHEFQQLLETENIGKIYYFLTEQGNRKIKHSRLFKAYPRALEVYYEKQEYSFCTEFSLLEELLNRQEDKFPSKNKILKSEKELSLFNENSFEEYSELIENRPEIILKGQNSKLENIDYSDGSYLEYINIQRIVAFFENTQIHTKSVFLKN